MPNIRKQLVSGSMYRVGLRVVRSVVSLFLAPFIVLTLGKEMYGIWTLVGAFMGFYGVMDLGLAAAVNRYVAVALGAEDRVGTKKIISTALVLYMSIGLAVLLLVAAAIYPAGWLVETPDQQYALRVVLLLMGISLATSFPLKVFGGILEARFRYDLLNIPYIVNTFVHAGLVIAALKMGTGVIGVAVVTLVTTLGVGLIHWFFARRVLEESRLERAMVQKSTAKELFHFSKKSFVVHIADVVRFNLDAFVIQTAIGLAAVTHYRVPTLITMMYIQLTGAVVGPLQPYMGKLVGENSEGKDNQKQQQDVFLFGLRISVYLALYMGVMLVLMGKDLLGRWMGPDFIDDYDVLLILTVGWFFLLSQHSTTSYLYAKARHSIIAWRNVIEAVFNLGLSLWLVRRYGIVGVALGTAVPMTIASMIAMPPFVCRVIEISLWRFYAVWAKAVLVGCVALALPVAVIWRYMQPTWGHIFGLGALALLVYLPVVWFVEFGNFSRPFEARAQRNARVPAGAS
ncbi:MAG: polysaccharide biosynthesis C-terminal domain-containing protein [Planctomycetota bacterium]